MPDPVPDYQDPPPPPRDDRGMGQAFAIALGGCALLAALGYAVEAADLAQGDAGIGLIMMGTLLLPPVCLIVGVAVAVKGRTRVGAGYILGGVAGFIVGFGTCLAALQYSW